MQVVVCRVQIFSVYNWLGKQWVYAPNPQYHTEHLEEYKQVNKDDIYMFVLEVVHQ